MNRLAYLLLIALLAFGCGSSGSNKSKQDVSYRVDVIEGWQEGDSLRVEYATGYDQEDDGWKYKTEIVTNSQFSTTESIDLSLSENLICISARFISARFFEDDSQPSPLLRLEMRTTEESLDEDVNMGETDLASVCLSGEAEG
jgi:hypothetical protein